MKVRSTSRGQPRKGDRPWGGRLCESHEPTNRNLIRGRSGPVSWHNTAKPFVSSRKVNQAVVWRRAALLPGEICPTGRPGFGRGAPGSVMDRVIGQKSAEAIVVATSRGLKDARSNNDTGTLVKAKGRTSLADQPGCPLEALMPIGGADRGGQTGRERESAWRRHLKRSSDRGRWGRHSKSRNVWTGLPKPE